MSIRKRLGSKTSVEIGYGVVAGKVEDGELVEWKREMKEIFSGTSMNSKLVKGAK